MLLRKHCVDMNLACPTRRWISAVRPSGPAAWSEPRALCSCSIRTGLREDVPVPAHWVKAPRYYSVCFPKYNTVTGQCENLTRDAVSLQSQLRTFAVPAQCSSCSGPVAMQLL